MSALSRSAVLLVALLPAIGHTTTTMPNFGPLEGYLYRSIVSEAQMAARAALMPFFDDPSPVDACIAAGRVSIDGNTYTTRREELSGFGGDGSATVCEVLVPIDGQDPPLVLRVRPSGVGLWEVDCHSELPAVLLPRTCGGPSDMPTMSAGAGPIARVASVALGGDASVLAGLRHDLAGKTAMSLEDVRTEKLVLQAEARLAQLEPGTGLGTWFEANRSRFSPATGWTSEDRSSREDQLRRHLLSGLFEEMTLATDGCPTGVPTDRSVLNPFGDEIREQRLLALCTFCNAPTAQERRALVRRWLAPADTSTTDSWLDLHHRLSMAFGAAADHCADDDWTDTAIEAAQTLLGSMEADSEFRVDVQFLLEAIAEYRQSADRVVDGNGTGALPIPSWVMQANDQEGSGSTPLDSPSVVAWLLERDEPAKRILPELARLHVARRWSRSLPESRREDFARARQLDEVFSSMALAGTAPEWVLAVNQEIRTLNADPIAVAATSLSDAYVLAMSGESGRLQQLLIDRRDAILSSSKAIFGEEAERTAQELHALFLAAARGESRQTMEQLEILTGACTNPLLGKKEDCASLRILLANEGIDQGELALARKFLSPFPANDTARDEAVLANLRRDYFAAVARLAIEENDTSTAREALARSSPPGGSDPSPAMDVIGIRIDLIDDKRDDAAARLARLRQLDLNGLPLAGKVASTHELSVYDWLIRRDRQRMQAIVDSTATEYEAVVKATRNGEASSVRSLLNARALRRDRNLSIAASGQDGVPLVYAESARFKGLEEAVGRSLRSTMTDGLRESGNDIAVLPDLESLRSTLPDDVLVVDFHVYQRVALPSLRNGVSSLAVLAFGKNVAPRVVDLGAFAPIDASIALLRRRILARDPYASEGKTLAGLLFAPIAAMIGDHRTILLIPDDALNLVPFDVLQQVAPDVMPDTAQLRFASSLRQAFEPARSRPDVPSALDMLIIAAPEFGTLADRSSGWPPLPGAMAEGRAIERLWSQANRSVRFVGGADATEDAIRALPKARLVHWATHGFAGPPPAPVGFATRGLRVVAAPVTQTRQSPKGPAPEIPQGEGLTRLLAQYRDPLTQVGLVLANANTLKGGGAEADGVLSGDEVLAFELGGTALVVLSACDTGQGDLVRGSAMGSLKRAFHQAGAEAVVSTLWTIPDAASDVLLVAFHERLLAGDSPFVALDRAKSTVRRNERFAAPFFWAGFQLSAPLDQRAAGHTN